MVAEQTHRYPRWITFSIEVLCALLVGGTTLLAGRDILRYIWSTYDLDLSISRYLPWFTDVVTALGGGATNHGLFSPTALLPSLTWWMLALLFSLLARNSLPTIRTSPRGMLVEFSGGWLPIPWESLTAIKVTEDFGAERFVLFAEASKDYLTGWHRLYGFLYRFSLRRGFLITSAIQNFDGLVKTLLSETDRVARALDRINTVKLQENTASPLFRFMLGPASFFSRRDSSEEGVAFSAGPVSGPIRGSYPARISGLFTWGAMLLAVLTLVRYVIYWLEFLALTFTDLLRLPVFDRLMVTQQQTLAPWWLLVAAHLMAIAMFSLLIALRHTLPEIEARAEGLAVRHFNRWIVLPWARIAAIKVTELSEDSQVVLIQASGGLPPSTRFASLLYDGSFKPGVLLTSAISSFEPLLQRVVLEVTRNQSGQVDLDDSPIFQSDAYSPLLFTSMRAAASIDRQIEDIRETNDTTAISTPRLLRAANPMLWLAVLPALLGFAERSIHRALLPSPALIVMCLLIVVIGMIEWPVVALAAETYDEMSGGGEEGHRPFYLYPTTQIPRALPLLGALILTLLGVPALPALLWLGAIGWSFMLAAGLWGTLYDWRGSQLLLGGAIPAIFQMLVLFVYMFALR
ncbi:hypothetical protein F8S13_23210 [Chloroflexia bacterium SDU3-3]|nr:hypothetical protein F8S13_23210 [Chloroflexia bacterium SDU3-3]